MHEEEQKHGDDDEEEEMHTAFGFGMDDEDEVLHTGAKIHHPGNKTRNRLTGVDAKNQAIEEMKIVDAYLQYTTGEDDINVYNMTHKLKSSDIPHNVFASFNTLQHSRDAKPHKMDDKQHQRLLEYRHKIKTLWKSADMTYQEYVTPAIKNTVKGSTFKKCMEEYKIASSFIAICEAAYDEKHPPKVTNARKQKNTAVEDAVSSFHNLGSSNAGAKKQVASMKDMHDKPASMASFSSWSNARPKPEASFGRTKSAKSIGDSSSSLSSIRAMLQQKTRCVLCECYMDWRFSSIC
jgi:hypothetical protein